MKHLIEILADEAKKIQFLKELFLRMVYTGREP